MAIWDDSEVRWSRFREKWTEGEWTAGKWLVGFKLVCWLGVITMSILGAERGSFHLISLKDGWSGSLWAVLWFANTAITFFLLGVIAARSVINGGESGEE